MHRAPRTALGLGLGSGLGLLHLFPLSGVMAWQGRERSASTASLSDGIDDGAIMIGSYSIQYSSGSQVTVILLLSVRVPVLYGMVH